mmetsp:Transcript_53048/g.94670  ORF Transcript_53048/g.94670 Transcript_53048/m.94670 type:complete len:380 (-) Transcript_53048:4253-5392(-)
MGGCGLHAAISKVLGTLVDQSTNNVGVSLVKQVQMHREESDVLLESTETQPLVHQDVTLADFDKPTHRCHAPEGLSLAIPSQGVENDIHTLAFGELHHLRHELGRVTRIHDHVAAHLRQRLALIGIPSTTNDGATNVLGDLQGSLSNTTKSGVEDDGVLLGQTGNLDKGMPSSGHHTQETSGLGEGQPLTLRHENGLSLLGDTLSTEEGAAFFTHAGGHSQAHHLVSRLELRDSLANLSDHTSTLHTNDGFEITQHTHGKHDILEVHGDSTDLHLHLVVAHILEIGVQRVPVQRAELPRAADLQPHIGGLGFHVGRGDGHHSGSLPPCLSQGQLLVRSPAGQQSQNVGCGFGCHRHRDLQGNDVQTSLIPSTTAESPEG